MSAVESSLSPAARGGLARMLGRLPELREALLPPPELLWDGSASAEEYRKYGEGDARLLVELGGLEPHHRVLDLGCGVGQKARPLTQYLTTGSYEGLDIMPAQIAWCTEHITGRFPNFRFQRADIYNKMYNPTGRLAAAEYRLPFPDAEFDFAYLVSVFTHLLPTELKHYLAELARVVKPGGRTLITYFLFDEEALRCMHAGGAEYVFAHTYESPSCRILDPEMPEAATAYEAEWIRGVYRDSGFAVVEPIHHGFWSGRDDPLIIPMPEEPGPYLQDVIVATRH
jgi:ubiquinone/menaquinone biosynthesis C-methylase UbiE